MLVLSLENEIKVDVVVADFMAHQQTMISLNEHYDMAW